MFDDTYDNTDAYFLDGGLTYDQFGFIAGVTKANPAVITCVAHGFTGAESILINGVFGMTELNGNTYIVDTVPTADTFTIKSAAYPYSTVDSSAFGTYISGGEVREYVSTISGLWHLEGESVSIFADGAAQPDATVANGAVTLDTPGATVSIGYGYNSDGQLLRIEAGAADGTALGKNRRTHRCGFLLHRTLGLKVGTSFDNLKEQTFRVSSDPMSRGVPLFSGVLSTEIVADTDFDNLICWRQSQPTPGMILAVMPQMEVQDRG